MAARVLPNLALKAFFAFGEDGWNDEVDINFLKLSVLVQAGVIDIITTKPTSPVEGTVFLMSAGASSNANAIAVYDNGAWTHFAPVAGWTVYNRATDSMLTFDGTVWRSMTLNPLRGLGALDASTGMVEQTGAATFGKRPVGVGSVNALLTRGNGDDRYAAIGHTHPATGVTGFNSRTGAVTLTSTDVTNALTFQPLAATTVLTNLGSLNTSLGIVEQSGPNSFSKRAIGFQPNDIATVTMNDSRYQPLATGLSNLAALETTSGIVEQNGVRTFRIRTIGTINSDSLLTRGGGDTLYAPLPSLDALQPLLTSGTNIKTLNGESLLGSGNIAVSGGGGGGGGGGSALFTTPFEVKDAGGESSLEVFADGDVAWVELTTRPNVTSGPSYGENFYAMMERGTKAAPLPVQNGDSLGGYGFGGRTAMGKSYGGAQIIGVVTAPAGSGATAGQIQTDLIFATRNLGMPISERVRIKSNGMLGIGTTAPTCLVHAVGGNNGDLARFEIAAGSGFTVSGQLVGVDFAQSTTFGTLLSYNPEGLGSNFVARYSRGTLASPAPVQIGDTLGSLRFAGYNGTDSRAWARISGVVDGTVSSSNVPTAVAFYTGPFSDTVERMRITSTGNVAIGTTAPNTAAALDVTSTTRGFLPPRMTTTQRDAITTPPNGLMLYNSTTDKLQVRAAGIWVDLH